MLCKFKDVTAQHLQSDHAIQSDHCVLLCRVVTE